MKRTQIPIDEETYANLRRVAYEQGRSMSSLVRETLSGAFGPARKGHRRTLKQFPFVGVGRSRQDSLSPVSERHDEGLVQAFAAKKRR